MRSSDWSSDVCSSDLLDRGAYANRVLSRLILLPTVDQVRVWNEIIGEYRAKIDELDMRGINPLRSKELPGRWRIVERRLFEGAEGGRRPFDHPEFRSEEHTSALQSLMRISSAVLSLKTTSTTRTS